MLNQRKAWKNSKASLNKPLINISLRQELYTHIYVHLEGTVVSESLWTLLCLKRLWIEDLKHTLK